jgi:hypothetical protein
MKTDSLFYRLFKNTPELLNWPDWIIATNSASATAFVPKKSNKPLENTQIKACW